MKQESQYNLDVGLVTSNEEIKLGHKIRTSLGHSVVFPPSSQDLPSFSRFVLPPRSQTTRSFASIEQSIFFFIWFRSGEKMIFFELYNYGDVPERHLECL